MLLFRLTDIHLAYGPKTLLDKVSLTIHKGERIGLLGRNGEGKSTFMKLLAGQLLPDGGELWQEPEIRVAYLDQELPKASAETVQDFLLAGLEEAGKLIQDFHHFTMAPPDQQDMKKLDALQRRMDAIDAWGIQQKVDKAVTRLGLDPEATLNSLSGGWLRRVALARAFVAEPDILLLDEPTNHLDIPTIQWLEDELSRFAGAVVLITHDRAFLQKVARRIMILDRGDIHSWECDYRRFLVYREQQLAAEEKARAEFDKRLAQEEVWIRQGIKARRTRNEGRVRALEALREEHRRRRDLQGKAKLTLNQSETSGKIVIEAENISHSFGGRKIIDDFSTRIIRGDKVGFIGPNGAGKTTLLRILLGRLQPENGKVKTGSKMSIAYFDQLRDKLEPEQNVYDTVSEGSDFVEINGKPRHVMSYLQDFLFTPDRARQKVRSLSGGEQNRLILACLFSKPANVLVLDEPTNDLDLETLELLEELLLDFNGTLLLVSHDRDFLDNVVSSSIVFEGNGKVREYVGGYQDWINQGGAFQAEREPAADDSSKRSPPPPAEKKAPPREKPKLTYKLQRELDSLPAQIEKAETEIARLEQEIGRPEFYEQDHEKQSIVLKQMADAQANLDQLFERWTELEQL